MVNEVKWGRVIGWSVALVVVTVLGASIALRIREELVGTSFGEALAKIEKP